MKTSDMSDINVLFTNIGLDVHFISESSLLIRFTSTPFLSFSLILAKATLPTNQLYCFFLPLLLIPVNISFLTTSIV